MTFKLVIMSLGSKVKEKKMEHSERGRERENKENIERKRNAKKERQ